MVLSIIIPVYNVECYLADCLDSVLACDLTDCEIILSLRPSKDGSEEVSRGYQARYPSIRIVWQDGKGLSDARNCAMREAKGDYILYIDSDDCVDSPVMSGLIERLRSAEISEDVVVTDYRRLEHQSGKTRDYFQIGEDTPDTRGMDFLPRMLRRRQCFWNVWRYIYRRSFLSEHQIVFMENTLSEDIDYTTSVFLANPTILFTHSPFYCYNVDRGGSLMDRPTLRRLRETLNVITISIGRLRSSSFLYREQMIAQYQFEYILNIALAVEIEPSDRNEALALFDNHREILRGSSDPAVRILAGMIGTFGVSTISGLLHRLKKVRRRIRGKERQV